MARDSNRKDKKEREDSPEFSERLVAINRVSKTVKGGKRFGFAALVVVGVACRPNHSSHLVLLHATATLVS